MDIGTNKIKEEEEEDEKKKKSIQKNFFITTSIKVGRIIINNLIKLQKKRVIFQKKK